MAQYTRVSTSWAASSTSTGTLGVAHSLTMPAGQAYTDGYICMLERTSNVLVDPTSLNATNAVISRSATTSGSVVLFVCLGVAAAQL